MQLEHGGMADSATLAVEILMLPQGPRPALKGEAQVPSG